MKIPSYQDVLFYDSTNIPSLSLTILQSDHFEILFKPFLKIRKCEPGMVMYTCNVSFRRLKQKNFCKFEANLGYKVSLKLAWAMQQDCLKKVQNYQIN